MTMRVVGFEYNAIEIPKGGRYPSRLSCPISPLGNLLQKHDMSSCDEHSRCGTDSGCTDSDGHFGQDICEECSYDTPVHVLRADMDRNEFGYVLALDQSLKSYETVPDMHCRPKVEGIVRMTSSTSSDPIPIPEMKPKSPKPVLEEPKNIKRVPEPPMLKAVTAPAVVEEVYQEYYRLKQQAYQDQLYKEMMASQGIKQKRKKSDEMKPQVLLSLVFACACSCVWYGHECDVAYYCDFWPAGHGFGN